MSSYLLRWLFFVVILLTAILNLFQARLKTLIAKHSRYQLNFSTKNTSASNKIETFADCRKQSDLDFELAAAISAPPLFPLPLSAFFRDDDDITYLYVALTNAPLFPSANGGKMRVQLRKDTNLQAETWSVKLLGNRLIDCRQVLGKDGKGDHHWLTVIIRCPVDLSMDPIKISVWNRFTLHYRLIENFPMTFGLLPKLVTDATFENVLSCQFEPPKLERYQLTACTQVGDDHIDRLPEWIEYHSAVGFQHFFIYVNERSLKRYETLLHVYVQLKLVTLATFYVDAPIERPGRYVQQASENDCIYRMKGRTDWMAIFDADEFFQFYWSNMTLLEYLEARYAENPALGGLQFNMWAFGQANGTSLESFETIHCPKANLNITSKITNMIYRETKFQVTGREKIIARLDNVWYFSVHTITNGGAVKAVLPTTTGRLVHYRNPPLPAFAKEQLNNELVYDDSFRKIWGFKVEKLLKSHLSENRC